MLPYQISRQCFPTVFALLIAFLLEKVYSDDGCERYNNANDCARNDCEFNLVKNTCAHKLKPCKNEDFAEFEVERLPDTVYGKAGVFCKQEKEFIPKTKPIPEQVYALNLGKGQNYDWGGGNKKLSFRKETQSDYEDPDLIRRANEDILDFCEKGAKSAGDVFKNLLKTYVHNYNQTKGCLSYSVPVKGDGIYELGLLFFEGGHKEKFQRCFNIKINDEIVGQSVDLARLVGSCKLGRIVFLFKVSGNKLYLNGFSNSFQISGGKFKLRFCKGSCGYQHENFIASAFYARKWKDPPPPPPPPPAARPPPTRYAPPRISPRSSQIKPGQSRPPPPSPSRPEPSSPSSFASEPPPPPPPPTTDFLLKPIAHPCNIHSASKKICTKYNCEYDLELKWCVHRQIECTSEDFTGYSEGRYQNVFYLRAGVFCKNKESVEMERKTVYAIVLARPRGSPPEIEFPEVSYEDQEVTFDKINRGNYVDEGKIRQIGGGLETCVYEPLMPVWNLVKNYVYGSKKMQNGCLTYKVPTEGDGDYELIIWTVEPLHRYRNKRCFDIMIHNVTVAKDVDLVNLPGQKCGWVSIGLHFKIEGNGMFVNGFSEPVAIDGGEFLLKFCQGGCGYEDISFVVSTFYVKKFI